MVAAGAYEYTSDLAYFSTCQALPTRELPPRMREIVTPLVWQTWDRELAHHPDQEFRKYIVEGIRYGFRIGFDHSGTACQSSHRNMHSAQEHPQVVRQYLAEECAEGRILGPLDLDSFPYVHTSRFGVIPKSSPGKWRLIVDLSSPDGSSVNDGIVENRCSLSYVGVEEAAREILRQGPGTLMAKVDIKSAYRNIPIHPDDRYLLGMVWEGALYIDTALPFGLRSAPKIFTAVADAAQWIIQRRGVRFVIHYLDDYLVVGGPKSDECRQALHTLLEAFFQLGLPVADDKLEGPAPILTFLGLQLDSLRMEIRLPPGKLSELQELIVQWRGKRSTKKKDLESLVGKLAFASRVVRPGKTFMRRMFQLLSGIRQDHHHVRLNAEFRSDLLWWATFIQSWNGVSVMELYGQQASEVHFATDASGQFGCGAVWAPAWFQIKWSDTSRGSYVKLENESITFKELLPIVVAGIIWGPAWHGKTVTVHCDNQGAVSVVNSGYSRVPEIMHLLRCLFFIRATFQFTLWAVYLPGRENALADAISRDNLSVLFTQVPQSVEQRFPVPQAIQSLLLEKQPDWTSMDWCQLFKACFQQA